MSIFANQFLRHIGIILSRNFPMMDDQKYRPFSDDHDRMIPVFCLFSGVGGSGQDCSSSND